MTLEQFIVLSMTSLHILCVNMEHSIGQIIKFESVHIKGAQKCMVRFVSRFRVIVLGLVHFFFHFSTPEIPYISSR